MDKLILLLTAAFALWYIIRRIKKQVNGEGGCDCCNGSCGLNCFKDDK